MIDLTKARGSKSALVLAMLLAMPACVEVGNPTFGNTSPVLSAALCDHARRCGYIAPGMTGECIEWNTDAICDRVDCSSEMTSAQAELLDSCLEGLEALECDSGPVEECTEALR
jgi:hypothetical protein